MTNSPGEGQPPEDPYPPGYGHPQQGAPMQYAPDHPRATMALVIGIVGIVVCGGLLSPVAWVVGKRALNDIEAARGRLGGRGAAQAGYILGIIGTCLLVFWVLAALAWLLLVIAIFPTSTSTSY